MAADLSLLVLLCGMVTAITVPAYRLSRVSHIARRRYGIVVLGALVNSPLVAGRIDLQ